MQPPPHDQYQWRTDSFASPSPAIWWIRVLHLLVKWCSQFGHFVEIYCGFPSIYKWLKIWMDNYCNNYPSCVMTEIGNSSSSWACKCCFSLVRNLEKYIPNHVFIFILLLNIQLLTLVIVQKRGLQETIESKRFGAYDSCGFLLNLISPNVFKWCPWHRFNTSRI